MDLVQTVRKEGSRGGRADFKWEDVKNDAQRENYLGHSLMAPVGRWQQGRDLNWYAKGDDDSKETEAQRIAEEKRKLKEAEEDAMLAAMGLPVPVRAKDNANLEPLGKKAEERASKEDKAKDEDEDRARRRDRKERSRRHRDDDDRERRRRHRSRSRSRDRDRRHAHRDRSRSRDRRRGDEREHRRKHRSRSREHRRRDDDRERRRRHNPEDKRSKSRSRSRDRRRRDSRSRSPYRKPERRRD